MEARVHLPPAGNIWRRAENNGVFKKPAGCVSASLSGWAGDGGPTPCPRFSAVRFCGTRRDALLAAGAAARQFRISDLRRSVHSFTDAGPDGADARPRQKAAGLLKRMRWLSLSAERGLGLPVPAFFPCRPDAGKVPAAPQPAVRRRSEANRPRTRTAPALHRRRCRSPGGEPANPLRPPRIRREGVRYAPIFPLPFFAAGLDRRLWHGTITAKRLFAPPHGAEGTDGARLRVAAPLILF